MSWKPPRIEDGQSIEAVLNTVFGTVESVLNNIQSTDITEQTFGRGHGGGVVQVLGSVASESPAALRTYDQAVFGNSLDYTPVTSFGDDAGSVSAVDIGTGSRVVVGHPSTGAPNTARIDLNTLRAQPIGMGNAVNDNFKLAGILMLANVEVWDMVPNGAADMGAMICGRYQPFGGSWTTLNCTERIVSWRDHMQEIAAVDNNDRLFMDIPFIEFIGPGIIDAKGDSTVDIPVSFDLCCSIASSSGAGSATMTLRNWNFSILGFYAADAT